MDKVGIDKEIIAIIDLGLELGEPQKSIIEIHREVLSICNKFPSGLVGFAGIDPRRPNAERVIKTGYGELGQKD
jgi:hypothetical protein